MPETITGWIGLAADLIGVGGAVFAGFAWMFSHRTHKMLKAEKHRLNEPVAVILEAEDGRRVKLPPLKRKELTRAELLGRVGMLPRKDPRAFFVIDYLSTPAFFEELARIQDASGTSEIVIRCTKQEMEQFKWNDQEIGAIHNKETGALTE